LTQRKPLYAPLVDPLIIVTLFCAIRSSHVTPAIQRVKQYVQAAHANLHLLDLDDWIAAHRSKGFSGGSFSTIISIDEHRKIVTQLTSQRDREAISAREIQKELAKYVCQLKEKITDLIVFSFLILLLYLLFLPFV
jgi:hypothetical protein